ncbi:VWA domain-containing protein [Yinghuangia sp. ASG 101]|uniref:VWA domain-containing protein n=1 Tax=Yinghuangia sp. ASG 101 TaxID=2896848 RepID=UPI001E2AFD1A|nr:VWA domain-containing protein [Yinghuangia sp. ASG 101]UGQ13728.1 VWA domain-containing protein [Yinghuangia sp. ASG 101]
MAPHENPTGEPAFNVEVFQNQYLPTGGSEVHAVATVTATGAAAGAAAGPRGGLAAEVILVDTSGSMDYPGTKLSSAKLATKAAIDSLREGTLFAVVAGTGMASMVYPTDERLVPLDDHTRREAKRAVDRLRARGGTAMGQWLLAARRLLEPYPHAIRHAILLTDGKDESETPADLAAAIQACQGVFTCDCRGVGTDWVVAELRQVASGLLGSLAIVADPADLIADFTEMIEGAMGKAVADVSLRLRTVGATRVKFVKQVRPSIEDLTHRRTDVGGNIGDYPTGAWGDESRDYHVCLEVAPGDLNDPVRVGVVSLVSRGADGTESELTRIGVFAEWTEDEQLFTEINKEVALYTGRTEMAKEIQEGLSARDEGHDDLATAKLRRALDLARQSEDEYTAQLIRKLVDEDPVTGTIKLRKDVDDADVMRINVDSVKTSRLRKPRTGTASAARTDGNG